MKLLFSTLSFFILFSLNAQTPKGAVLFGINLNASSYSEDDKYNGASAFSAEESSFRFNPQIGFYVSKNVIIGMGLGYEGVEYSENQRGSASSSSFRYNAERKLVYYNPFFSFQSKLSEKLKFDFLTEFSIIRGSSEYRATGQPALEGKVKGLSINLRPGFFYFLTPKTVIVGRYGSLGYTKLEDDSNTSGSVGVNRVFENEDFGFNFGYDSFSLGFMFLFSKENKSSKK